MYRVFSNEGGALSAISNRLKNTSSARESKNEIAVILDETKKGFSDQAHQVSILRKQNKRLSGLSSFGVMWSDNKCTLLDG